MTSEYLSDKATGPILVSISCITYNHAPYIRQCLDGFMMQQTNFAFEVLIHDDASTDGTTDIIKEYEAQYPDIIKPIYEEENQWVKGRRGSAVFNFPRANGKYIALCEGDDYWTDPLKLQKQVDFLESNQYYSMCSHWYVISYDHGKQICHIEPSIQEFTIDNLIRGEFPIQTATVLYRKMALNLEIFNSLRWSMDASLFYLVLKTGKCYILDDTMSTYRVHSGGVWSGTSNEEHIKSRINVVRALYDIEHSDIAARYLINQYSKGVGRKWMLTYFIQNMNNLIIGFRHFGVRKILKFCIDVFILNKPNISI